MENIETVRSKLWKFGYSVKDMSKFASYDLLVQGKYRLKVVDIMPDFVPKGCDILAVVNNELNVVAFVKEKASGKTVVTSPYPVFGRPPNQA